MNNLRLKLLKEEDENQFILDNQRAFKFGAQQYFTESEMEEQYEEEGEIISRETIYNSIHKDNTFAYRIIFNNEKVGGIVLSIEKDKGDLELFFVLPECHSLGIGQASWKEIERIHSNVKIWETCTPTFEKRNIHFYVNKLGFHIVEYFNEHHHGKDDGPDMFEMYRFEKFVK